MQQPFTSRDVVSLTGITPRQLQWWDERRIVVPAREGRRRMYSMEDLAEVAVICELRRRGFSVRQLHSIIDCLKERFGTRLFDATGGGGPVQLLTDGREIYARTARGEFYNLLKGPTQPLLVIGDEGLLKELGGKVRRRRRKKRPNSSQVIT